MLRLSVIQDKDAHRVYPIRQSCSMGTARTPDNPKTAIGVGPGSVANITCCSRMDCAGTPGSSERETGMGYGVNKLIWGIRDGKTWGEDLISDLLECTIVYLAVVEDVLG